MVDQNQQKPEKTDATKNQESAQPGVRMRWITFAILGALALIGLALLVYLNADGTRSVFSPKQDRFIPPEPGTWRFIVSGDSRNCGDIVVPTIAAHSSQRYQPAFYWHLGDLRAIYKIDEDMAAEAQKKGDYLSCKSYLPDAWPDFIKHQIAPFGTTRFYVGIGNHEVIPPKTAGEFSSTFEDWLATPRRQMASLDSKRIASSKSPQCQAVAKLPYVTSLPYYHWIQGTVDFIYLDNSTGSFTYKKDKTAKDYSQDQLEWFECILGLAQEDKTISTVVVGMHEALPHSNASSHAMCDAAIADPEARNESCKSGERVYSDLLEFQKKKRVYVLASHSHFYLKGIFDQHPAADRIPGWIVGTAGAVRYSLPDGINPSPSAQQDTYGYLLGTVKKDGEIDFDFKEVKESEIPSEVRQRYPAAFTSWCFAHNSQHKDPIIQETTNRCSPVLPTPTPSPSGTPGKTKK
jgi:hypothetical protein